MQYRPNRRKTHVRAQLLAEGETRDVDILDISRDGAKITIPFVLLSGTAVHLHIDTCRIKAIVQWCKGPHAGLRFLDRLDRKTLIAVEDAGLELSDNF